MRSLFLIALITCISATAWSQEYNFENSWESLGPNKKPLEDRPQYANGIGPVEFIRASNKVEGLLLAGSLNGGLFYSTDGGEQWINSGSDDWPYSGVGWAEFHPSNEKVWFANSCLHNDNGSPGPIGHEGGIYRTLDGGLNWELVADKSTFINSEFISVFGFKFHPNKENTLYVFTSEGLYSTSNCLATEIVWKRVGDIGGWIYDLTFSGDKMYLAQMQFGKWNVRYAKLSEVDQKPVFNYLGEFEEPILSVTLAPYKNEVLVLKNYTQKGDELVLFSEKIEEWVQILRGQRVVFGKGRTFAVSPHRKEEMILGYSTTTQRWNIETKKNIRMKGGYHVDIEGVLFDPFDSMKVYLATHGGVYTSFDNCESWKSTSVGLGVAEAEGLAVWENDPEQMTIGCFHDGSSMRADFAKNGIYEWKNVNGGDGLLPLQATEDGATIYTSNQFTGGGLYVSADTGRTKKNIHNQKGLKTSGWQMAAVLHPDQQEMVIFNYQNSKAPGKGNIDVCRTTQAAVRDAASRISDFTTSHQIEKYSIYGLYNSPYYPDELYAHMIHMTTNEKGEPINVHRLFKTNDCTVEAEQLINSWYELEIPRNDWISNVTPDPFSSKRIYLSYVSGEYGTELTDEDYGMIYQLKFKKGMTRLKREIEITENIPFSFTGRYNLTPDGAGGLFFATRTGVYYGDKKTLKGKRDWVKIGFGLPHCRIHGIYFHKKTNSLTVGLYGRGVWRYYL